MAAGICACQIWNVDRSIIGKKIISIKVPWCAMCVNLKETATYENWPADSGRLGRSSLFAPLSKLSTMTCAAEVTSGDSESVSIALGVQKKTSWLGPHGQGPHKLWALSLSPLGHCYACAVIRNGKETDLAIVFS